MLGDGTQSAQLVTPETHHINRIYPSQSYQSNQNFWCYYRCGYCLSFIVSEENIAGYINMANFKLFDIFGFNVSTMYELDSMHNYLHWASMVWLLSLFI